MKKSNSIFKRISSMFVLTILVTFTILINTQPTYAHCDTLDGPVIKAARTALKEKNVTSLLKWVRPSDESEIKKAFKMALTVRSNGGEAMKLADLYFFETLVRIHRSGEGVPYTGIKPASTIDPALVLADKALENNSVDQLVNILSNAMEKGIRKRFTHAGESLNHSDDNVESGRKFVKAYVTFTHYIEGIHGLIKGNSAHHEEK
ncbi:MAG: hypothetical protein KAG61_05470 [Bacteriovoracaceae bacterium]|nr:hypothetical protein [Bacteriovoracaceae bacterium]